MTRNLNKQNIRFSRDEEENIDVKTGKCDTNNQPKKSTFKYEQEGRFCLGVSKIEVRNGTRTGKRCPVFDFSGKGIVNIDAYKIEIQNFFARVQKLTSSSSQWIEKQKLTRYGYVKF